ncbi:arginine exporter protein ArgO [Rhizobium leguminosarum]
MAEEMNFSIYITGLMMGLSLIVAIGAQNAFILRQGLRNEHIFAVCLACAVSDAALIVLGVTSLQQIARFMPWLDPVMRYGGAAFLVWYGARSLYSALRSSAALTAGEAKSSSFRQTLATCLALTWLNPHVYLDTVVLLRHDIDAISGRAGFLCGRGGDGFLPVLLFARIWRKAAAADLLETLILAHAGNARRFHDVDHSVQTAGRDVIGVRPSIIRCGASRVRRCELPGIDVPRS